MVTLPLLLCVHLSWYAGWWWFRLCWDRVQLSRADKAKVPGIVLSHCLEAAYFQSYCLFAFYFTQKRWCAHIVCPHHRALSSAISGMIIALLVLLWCGFFCSLKFGTKGVLTCTINQVPVFQDDECSFSEELGKEYYIPCRALWEHRWYSLMLQVVPVFCLLPGNQEVMGLAVPISVSSLLSSPFPFSSWHECRAKKSIQPCEEPYP